MSKTPINLNGRTILVTGSPGFIGANLVMRLRRELKSGTVISFDNMNDYYDPELKEYRLRMINAIDSPVRHVFIRGSIADKSLVDEVFAIYKPSIVVNLAAQAGVRYSIDHPDVYIESNLIGFYNILEACRHSYDDGSAGVEHLVYASSSSVYGGNKKVPFAVEDKVDNPVSLYAATKKSNELLAHSYSKLYNIPSTGLRFFTVYGPAGRPAATANATSLMLTTSSRVSSVSCREHLRSRLEKMVSRCRPTLSTTSAAAHPKTCWTISQPYRKNSFARVSCPRTMISKATGNS